MEASLAMIREMLIDRGHSSREFDSLGSPLEETNIYTYDDILIIFSTKTRVSEKEFNIFLKYAEENNHKNGMIIISLSEPADSVLNSLCEYIENREHPLVQLFAIRKLQLNPTKHKIYSIPHKIVDDKIKAELITKYCGKLTPEQTFPRIWCQDPQAKWIGARPGDIVEVEGWCVASASNTRWRICVANING